jgi:hypothetical protein
MDRAEREMERQAAAGDLDAFGRLAFLRIRQGDWSTFIDYRLASGTPRRNLELAWHLGHPGMRSAWSLEDFQRTGIERVRPLVTSSNLDNPCKRLSAVMDNCFYVLGLLWKLRISTIESISQLYLDGTELLAWEDYDALSDLGIIPTHEQARIIMEQDNQLSDNITLIDSLEKIFDYSSMITVNRKEDLDFPNNISDTQLYVLTMLANSICSIYYQTDAEDVSTAFLHQGLFSVEILGRVAARMTRVINVVSLSLDHAIEAKTYMQLEQEKIPYSWDSEEFKARYQLLCQEKAMELAELLLYDERTIPPGIERLFGELT